MYRFKLGGLDFIILIDCFRILFHQIYYLTRKENRNGFHSNSNKRIVIILFKA